MRTVSAGVVKLGGRNGSDHEVAVGKRLEILEVRARDSRLRKTVAQVNELR